MNNSTFANAYSLIPHELSGARSKNRFRQEVFWGVSKMFDLFDKPDFCVVFDYKCDIEVHYPDILEFYQVKTKKVAEPYTFRSLATKKKGTGKSIIGQLYLLRNLGDDSIDIKVAIVSNTFFKYGDKVYSDIETLLFSDLDDATQKTIKTALKKEITEGEIDLTKISYIFTSMDLTNPDDALRGKIVKHFELIKKTEPLKPNALYRLIVDTANGKASYELKSNDYDELVKNKGITKIELSGLLDRYAKNEDACVDATKKYIEELNKGVRATKKLKSALVAVCGELIKSKFLKEKERDIAAYLSEHEDELPDDDNIESIVDVLIAIFDSDFGIEHSKELKYVFYILIIKRWEDNQYA